MVIVQIIILIIKIIIIIIIIWSKTLPLILMDCRISFFANRLADKVLWQYKNNFEWGFCIGKGDNR